MSSRITSSCRGCSRARSRTSPTQFVERLADDQPAAVTVRVGVVINSRRSRSRSACTDQATSPASIRNRSCGSSRSLAPPTSSPTTSRSSSSIVPIFPGCSARRRPTPRAASGRGSCSWSFAGSRAWSSGPPATRRCRCSRSSRRPGPATSCPIWPSRTSGRTRRRRARRERSFARCSNRIRRERSRG